MSILVFDIGSSGLKAALYSHGGTLTAFAEAGYGPAPAPHRQNPEDWWQAAIAATRRLEARADISALVLTGTMENLVAVDRDGTALAPAMLYPDPSGGAALDAMAVALEEAGARRILGNAPEPLMTAFKAMALRTEAPGAFAAADHLLPGAKDALVLRMTGRAVTDPTTAATTGLMDLAARDWSDAMLALFGIDRARLPAIAPATAIVGPLRAEAAAALGLQAGLPVVNGCGDGGATTAGSGATARGDTSLYLGTSGWVARVIAEDPDRRTGDFYRLAHPLSPDTIAITPILSAGAAAHWARTTLGLDPQEADRLALAADATVSDVMFLPYLSGERSPFLDLALRAGFIGIDAETGPGALYRAVLEGVGLAIAANLEAMGPADGEISLVGGGALSPIWPQLIADLVGAPISVPADPVSATALGGWRIGCAALGLEARPERAARLVQPRPERAARTGRLKTRFAQATTHLRALARL